MKAWIAVAVGSMALAGPVVAQTPVPSDQRLIMTLGIGETRRSPDYVEVTFSLRGEGATSVAALQQLTATQARIEASLKGERAVVRVNTTDLSTQEVRAPECNRGQVVLSTGACSVTGAVAALGYRVRVSPERSGDVTSLMAQLGAVNPRLGARGVNDEKSMSDQALAIAFTDARNQAQAAATAAGLKLGPVLRIMPEGRDGRFEDMLAAGARAPAPASPPPLGLPPVAAPVSLQLEPVVKTARLNVMFALEP